MHSSVVVITRNVRKVIKQSLLYHGMFVFIRYSYNTECNQYLGLQHGMKHSPQSYNTEC